MRIIFFLLLFLLAVFVLIIILLFFNVSFTIFYSDGFKYLKFKFLFINKKIRLDKKKKLKDNKAIDIENKKEKINIEIDESEILESIKDEIEKEDKLESIYKNIEFYKDIINKSLYGIKKLFKHLYIENVNIGVLIYKGDPFDTAIHYGKFSAYIYSTLSYISNIANIDIKRCDVRPNFVNDEEFIKFSCKIVIKPVIILIIALKVGFVFLKYKLKTKLKGKRDFK